MSETTAKKRQRIEETEEFIKFSDDFADFKLDVIEPTLRALKAKTKEEYWLIVDTMMDTISDIFEILEEDLEIEEEREEKNE